MTNVTTLTEGCDSAIVLPRATRPGSFTALMTLYESNYVRFGALGPVALTEGARFVSHARDDLPLYLAVEEVCRYTTTLRMTYLFDEPGGTVADPDLKIRLYRDARLLEAMACTGRHRHRALRAFDTGIGSELRRRWNRNVMLNKWLEHCIDAEHRFEPLAPDDASGHKPA